MNQFYILNTYLGMDSKHYAGGQHVNYSTERCSICNTLTDPSDAAEPNVLLDHVGKLGFTEHLWSSIPIFRRDLFTIWEQARLTGFTMKTVHIMGWRKATAQPLPSGIPDYAQLIVKSNARLFEPSPVRDVCPQCGFTEYSFPRIGTHLDKGIRIDTSTWDSSDIFGLRGYSFIFCTRRVAETTIGAGFNQRIIFVKAEEWSRWEEYDATKWNPADYRQYLETFLIRRTADL